MIDQIHVQHLKSLRDSSLDLERCTVLVGPNGSGKSSLLFAMDMLSRCCASRSDDATPLFSSLENIFGGGRALRRLISAPLPATLSIQARVQGQDTLRLSVDVSPHKGDNYSEGVRFRIQISGMDGHTDERFISPVPIMDAKNDIESWMVDPRITRFSSSVYLRLNSSEMTKASFADDETPRMREDGSGLASSLAWIKGANDEDFEKITEGLSAIVPGVRRIRMFRERVKRNRVDTIMLDGQPVWRPIQTSVIGDRFEIEFDNGESIPAEFLSEGTVLVLGLLTKLYEPRRPQLLLLDDIDRGLHIGAQARLVQGLNALMAADPSLQIICTAHSPYLLDRFAPEQVRVLALDEHRSTHILPLTCHPEFHQWKFGVQTGELWAALGDAWVTHRNASVG